MTRRKSLILVLQLLTISYHMSKLTAVITHNSSRARPSSVTSWATILYCGLLHSPMFRPTRALLIWAEGRAGDDIYV